jgi:hypothetical protein
MSDQERILKHMATAIQNATNTLSTTFGLDDASKKLLEATLKNTATMTAESYKVLVKNHSEDLYRNFFKEINER